MESVLILIKHSNCSNFWESFKYNLNKTHTYILRISKCGKLWNKIHNISFLYNLLFEYCKCLWAELGIWPLLATTCYSASMTFCLKFWKLIILLFSKTWDLPNFEDNDSSGSKEIKKNQKEKMLTYLSVRWQHDNGQLCYLLKTGCRESYRQSPALTNNRDCQCSFL